MRFFLIQCDYNKYFYEKINNFQFFLKEMKIAHKICKIIFMLSHKAYY
ncbi:hypothetical protein Fleli_1375 [Bernardetia litoralis DSM 6794]|uniref:Uncharacterized protein n=1 Tax=Bernardetia litoralis (strain ATCC 23117 / DSM 6794 / NBRC 15988 / NCIMB 1366 / Fx l1 / Sio-4) TaxID=880071 RepID=I4AIM1_BERLS|nr:hypothetical protein Fleli_1375 [Bernardetia litoralis DSM 6794]